LFPLTAHADLGPKPSITVILHNPPQGEYYLDLLINKDLPFDNLTEEEKAAYDPIKLHELESYDHDGWYAGLAHGTGIPMFGTLMGEMKDGRMYHTFGYFGVPDQYKIIIITPDNQIKVSEEIRKVAFQETIVLDYSTMAIEAQPSIFPAFGKQFLMTFIPTIVIEGILLILFGFSLKKNWLVFLGVNLVTQLIMTAILGTVLIRSGLFSSYIAFIPVEIGIIAAEVIAYKNLLKGHSNNRKIAYAIVANMVSAVIGILLVSYELSFIFG